MICRGVRGAISVEENNPDSILNATRQLLEQIIQKNGILKEDVPSVIFSATDDLDAVYPAKAARDLGWTETALMCMQEMKVTGSLRMCIRVLIHWNTDIPQAEIKHIYLGEAKKLRPDLSEKM
ncbi:MAG: chorismate mutase [Chloroflexota bacterium]